MSFVKKKSLFWRVYKISLAVALLLLCIVLIVGAVFLKDYEASQYKYVAEEVFNTYFKNFDAEKYAKTCSVEGGFESVDDIAEALGAITDGKKIEYYRVSSGMEQSYKYIVKADDVKFASFKLVEDTEAKGRFTTYKATDFQLYIGNAQTVVIEAPADYTVYINGNKIGEDCITEKDIKSEESFHIPDDITGMLYTQYTVENLMTDPEILVTDEDGKQAEVSKKDDGIYRASFVYDESLKDEYNDWILKGMKRYAEYMQHSSNNPVTFGEIAPYFDPASDLYEDIRTEENMFVWDYDSVDYENDDTSAYVRYDDNTFSCRVTFIQILHKSGENDYKDHLDVTLYLRNVNGKYLIYDMGQN